MAALIEDMHRRLKKIKENVEKDSYSIPSIQDDITEFKDLVTGSRLMETIRSSEERGSDHWESICQLAFEEISACLELIKTAFTKIERLEKDTGVLKEELEKESKETKKQLQEQTKLFEEMKKTT